MYYFQNESECFIGVSKHRETNERRGCRVVQVCVGVSYIDITDEHLEDLSWKRDSLECHTVILCRTRRGSIKKVSTIRVIFNALGYYQSKHTGIRGLSFRDTQLKSV